MENFYNSFKKVKLFEGIEEQNLKSLLSCLCAKAEHFDKNQAVYTSGESAVYVGIVLNGQVQLIKDDYYGNRSIIEAVNAGMLFGEAFACADAKTLPFSVVASAESDILFIDYRKLITTCSHTCTFHSRLIYNMLKIMSTKNILLTQKIDFTSKRTTREKLLAYLSSEAFKSTSNSFEIPFNRQQLADYLYVDRSAMSAELCKLRDEGVIRFNKNQFELL